MRKKIRNTIIIGGGIAGLSCAKRLADHGKDFILITKNVGGRILTSEKGDIPYGAYFIARNYHHVKNFVAVNQRITTATLQFHKNHQSYSLCDKRLATHFLQLVRLIILLFTFKKQYEKFKRACENKSQKEVLANNPFLLKLYHQNAKELITEYKIKDLVEDYLSEVLHGTTFLPIRKLNGFTFLQLSLPLIVPIYSFTFLKNKLIQEYRQRIVYDCAIAIMKNKEGFVITSKKRKYYSKNVVVATPPHVSKMLLKLKEIKKPVNVHMFHITGTLRKSWKSCDTNLFSDTNRMLALAHQKDNTFLCYSLGSKPLFKEYFTQYSILRHRYWNPAFNLEGHELWDCKIKENIYLIGDHNICGLEDAFITGIYAANQIVSKTRTEGKSEREEKVKKKNQK